MKFNERILIVYVIVILGLMLSFGIVLAQYAQQTIGEIPGMEGSEQAAEASRNIWVLTLIMISVTAVTFFILSYQIFIRYVEPVRKATDTAEQLKQGNYRARTYDVAFGDAGRLGSTINELAKHLKELTSAQGMQETRLRAVINHMSSGLVLIDEKGYIQLVNEAFVDTFRHNKNHYLDCLYHEVIPYQEVQSVIEKVYMFESPSSQMLTIEKGIEKKFIQVNGAPIFKQDKRWQGVVLVFHDITGLKRLEQMRKDFVANVSHELRTPITSIKGFSETLLDGALEDRDMTEQFLGIMLKESTRLETLIHDLLELSKIEREGFRLSISELNMTDLVNDTVTLVEEQAKKKDIEIISDLETDVRYTGDATRLRQVFLNLISNAITYTPEKGSVEVRLEEQKDEVRVEVIDTGIGIPEEEIPRIFERFYRVDRARSRNSGGTGLGLAIVKHIMEAHGGSIQVKSEPGEGSVMTLIFHKESS
ncbi:two-component system histidine kinase PnpS [Salimicrobium halophilum]|uniref:histidine kinase n=1 Tax=Salimicrobium halophilum TaxID=86666 RepID=A0A1G8VHH4_9BACI|nr:ATP-binding protein [Salimicrobium halophilum]SDJ65419.1 two-component system, OmpR family, phosphate regulon sensor histidine kinase PhoR [Salimicrobium halophilum]